MKKIAIIIIILALVAGGFYIGTSFASSNSNNNSSSYSNTSNLNRNTFSNQNINNNQNSSTNSTNIARTVSTNNSQNNNQGLTVNEIPQGYGDFSCFYCPPNQEQINSMPNGDMYLPLNINLNNQTVTLNLDVTNVSHLGKLLVVRGYYVNKPFEEFTYYLSNTSKAGVIPQSYKMYEFYNGQHTATFNLHFGPAAVYGGVIGTFKHIGSNQTYNCQGPFVNPNPPEGRYIGSFPYYNGNINGTNVSLATINFNTTFPPNSTNTSTTMKEKYSGDNNILDVNQIAMPSKFANSDYKYALQESYDGSTTGLYLLNVAPNDHLTGIFMHSTNGNFNLDNSSSVNFKNSVLPSVN
ncbi:MAG: hypothetical protein ACRC6T_13530 [Sarcina sp.]